MKKDIIPLALLVSLLLLFRIGGAYTSDNLPNIMPFAALFFCAAVFARACPLLLPAAAFAWVLGGPITSMIQGYQAFGMVDIMILAAILVCALIGFQFRGKTAPIKLVGGTLLAATLFYLMTNTYSFLIDPAYPKTWDGLTMAMWTGHPVTNLPTWVFFRNSLCANTVFTLLFVATLKFPSLKTARRFGLEPLHTSH